MRSRVAIALLAAAASGCAVDVSLEGKRCPCSEGYVCDEGLNRCVLKTCDPTFTVTDFALGWATPNTLFYRWVPTGAEADFLRYEIVVAQNEDDLATRTGTARVYGPDQNPELAFYGRPQTSTGIVDYTMARDLEPGTFYIARLVATDVGQCAFASEVVASRTQDAATSTISLFEDDVAPPAYALPSEGMEVTGGELVYTPAHDSLCTPTPGADPVCGPPVRVQGLAVVASQTGPETSGLTGTTFPQAFLEVRVANRGEVDSHLSEVSLWLNECNGEANLYELYNISLAANDTYQILQVPLSVLRSVDGTDTPLEFSALDTPAGGTAICGVAIGAQWNKTGQASVDYFRIRY